MKVLHFIPRLSITSGSNIFGYKTELMDAMSKDAEVHLLTADVIGQPISGISVHKYSPLKNIVGSRFSSFDKFFLSIHPDIVHIHSCWNIQAYYFLKCCLKHRLQVIVTVDKQLEAWHVANHRLFSKLPKTFLYQHRMIARASLIHAVSNFEKENIDKWMLSFPFSKKSIESKIEVVEIFKKQYGYTAVEMAKELLSLYRKVIDARPFLSMSHEDCKVEDLFIKAALSEDFTANELSQEDKNLLSSVTEESYRMISLHSYIQGTFELLFKGAEKCECSFHGIDVEDINSSECSCVSNCINQNLSDVGGIDEVMSDSSLTDVERNICCCIMNFKYKLINSLSTMSRSDFAILYDLLRYSNYNEVLLRDKMIKHGLDKFVARLFFILKERYGLGEGFMFIEPVYDAKTKKLMTKLYKTDIQ